MVGIVVEQHPDRALLFMQWKRMGWPLMVDAQNLLQVPYVPITLSIDEHGIVQKIHPPLGGTSGIESFVEQDFEPPAEPVPAPPKPDLAKLAAAASRGSTDALRRHGEALLLWGGPAKLDAAIESFEEALARAPDDPWAHFRLGVAYRMRHDSTRAEEGDFQRAADHWARSLDLDPNNYITRRRIQQYGPRLAKPYPFYDWTRRALEEIAARGETPVELAVEPGGAEVAAPSRAFDAGAGEEPDPEGRILRDKKSLIRGEATVVPATIAPGAASRVHLALRPNRALDAHWNNEVGDLSVWIDAPEGWEVDAPLLAVARPDEEVSLETRTLEFEVRAPESASGEVTLPAYALYYVCEGRKGACLYLRKDLDLTIHVTD
jgi:tetratricopeptide (TPR) repeat protein